MLKRISELFKKLVTGRDQEALLEDAFEFMDKLPVVGLGMPLNKENPFQGKEKVFFEFYVGVLGEKKVKEVLEAHGFERSALFGLHAAAKQITAIPKSKLLELSGGDRELVGFSFQFPTLSSSWLIPGEHYKAEIALGRAICQPLN